MIRENSFRRWRFPKRVLVFSSCVLLVAACRTPLADDQPRPIGIGRTSDEQVRFIVPLCEGEEISSLGVEEHQTERPIWKVSQPLHPKERSGEITLGDARGFGKQEIPLQLPLPPNISVTVRLTDDLLIGSGFLLNEVPKSLSGTNRVLNANGREVSEEEFRMQIDDDYC